MASRYPSNDPKFCSTESQAGLQVTGLDAEHTVVGEEGIAVLGLHPDPQRFDRRVAQQIVGQHVVAVWHRQQ